MFRHVFAGLALIAAPAAVATTAVPCNSCVSDEDFRDAALQRDSNHAGGTYWVYNLRDGTVQKWSIAPGGTGADATGPDRQPVAGSTDVPTGKRRAMYLAAPGEFARYIVPVESLHLEIANRSSIADVLGDNNLRAQLESALGSAETLAAVARLDPTAGLATTGPEATGRPPRNPLSYRLVMHDGTSMDFVLDLRRTVATALPGSARNAAGLPITRSSP